MTGPQSSFRLVPSETYAAKRAALDPGRALVVGWAEEELETDPTHVHWRRPQGRGTILDFAAADRGVVIEFQVLEGGVVALVDLIDVTSVRPP